MYAAPHYRENRPEVLLELIRDVRFAALAVSNAQTLTAAHIPMVANMSETPLVLEAHVARGNDAWRVAGDGAAAIAVFQGPHAYVHPGWYGTKHETGEKVPTWNYAVVEARGRLTAVEDQAWLRDHLDRLTALNENQRPQPWAVSDAPAAYVERLLHGIVGLRLEVETLEGSWKMGQGLSAADRRGAIAGLMEEARAASKQVARIMQQRAPSDDAS